MEERKGKKVAEKQVQEEQPGKKDSTHNRDTSSKAVFGNPVLCAQFLRDNFDVPVLKGVQPEDIEDISERYLPYLGTEMDSDSVEKVRILDVGKGNPPFFVSLIEHKSSVDYDVSMQLLRYMVCIWTEYRREKEAESKGCTRRKGFRYPVIMPVVYYEGKREWTAGMRLRDRIGETPLRSEWIPDFRYELIRIHDYSSRELLERRDEMSLVMLINKIQDVKDLEGFLRIPTEELDQIVRNSPEHVVDVLASVMESLCFKIDASAEERVQCVRKVRERRVGYLFENMEKMSLQEERRKTAEAQKKAEEMQKRAEETQKRLEEAQKKAEAMQKKAEAAEEKLRIAEETIRRLNK